MNITRNISLSLLLASLAAPSAFAAMSADSGGNAAEIEVSSDDAPAQHRMDQTLAVKVLDETFLQQRHARSSLRAPAPMEGHYDSKGGETPELFGRQDLSVSVSHNTAPEGGVTGLAQAAAAVHDVGSNSVTGEAPVASAGVVSAPTQYVVTSTSPNVPLPPAFLLLASGLFCLPTVRQRIKRAC